ncbi:MAG: hypothetical protein GXO39_03415 [Thermotogae bacterium]|nr:hypothetical protein [Thermotogota bacterium]
MKEKPLTEFIGSKKATKEHKEKPAEPKVVGLKGPWELPEGWRWVRLGEIAKLTSGGTPSRKIKEYWENGTIPWVKSGELEDNVIYTTEEKITERGLKESSAKMFPKGTLLVALYGATVGKTAILGIDATTNQAVCAVLPPNRREAEWDARYLQYYFIAIRPMLISKSGGGAQPNIYLHTLRRLEVPLPPLPEQKRTVAKLDEVSKRLEEAKRLAREARGEAEKLMASALHEIFEKLSKQYQIARFEELMSPIPKKERKITLEKDKEYKLVTVKMHARGVILREIKKGSEIKAKHLYLVHAGEFIFSRIDARNGAMGFVPPELDGAVVSQDFPVMILDQTKALQKYIEYYIKRPELEQMIQDYSTGTTNRQRISEEELVKILKIPLPPLEEQKRIVAYLDRISERAQKLVKLYEEREKELEQLFPAILDRAFRGEL